MLYRSVVLNIFCNKKPYDLTIIDGCGKVLKQTKSNAIKSNISFSTSSCKVKVIAKFNKQILQKTLCLTNCCQQKFYVEFAFKTILSFSISIITLTDANYNLPVEKATLNFNQPNFISFNLN